MSDHVLPFQTESSHLRGRLVRLGPLLDEILGRHDYPEPVRRLLAETVTLAAALAAILKYDGVFTLQIKGDGPINLIVADVVGHSDSTIRTIRGYARYDEDALAEAASESGLALIGEGWLAFTVDQGPDTERYQGIVALSGESLADCVRHYFNQSEQLPTGIIVAIGDTDGWSGTALLLQRLPSANDETILESDSREDDWRRAMVLMSTLTPAEMLDPALPGEDLLFRLFHEDGVRVFHTNGLVAGCRCSYERVSTVLRSLDRAEVESLRDNGEVVVTCEFCNARYTFDDTKLAELFGDEAP
ncbi:MAG: Hsp33 family molecular chaperone HslO [Rhodospirillaceae bacterium]